MKYRIRKITNNFFNYNDGVEQKNTKYIIEEYTYSPSITTDEIFDSPFHFIIFLIIIIPFLLFFKISNIKPKKQYVEIYSYNNYKKAKNLLNYLKEK
jgi:hypothetical protein